MNTAFNRWGGKFVITKAQQWWKKSVDNRKLYNYSVTQSVDSVRNHDTIFVDQIFAKNKCLQLFLSPISLNKQTLRLLSISRNRCWKCNAVITERDLVCMSCGSVQEPNQRLNYFELFKESPHFDVDTRNLTVKFRRLQTLLHPDKYASRPEKEKEYSAEQSSLVNKAYQTLRRPIDRGLYLLELHSNPLSEDDIQMSSEFLASVMEVNESLAECSSPRDLESIRHLNDAKIEILYSDVSLAFKEKNIAKARESLAKLKYYINIDEKVRQIEDELGLTRD